MTREVILSTLELDLLYRCAGGEDIRSSDRPSDRARTRLKKLGYITFDREKWRWVVVPDQADSQTKHSRT